ncbi:uncharacterized protein L201_007012 [Kwoniella dendrophila CBS 6074]|uniref:Zn(2)-C6 fungal-type domain-containing protein n=1 Tax=Kwoniella dendrophila CBS 6074 TaxID=1295534 RepID=A0AAX4K4N2_9TREE
MSQIPRQLKTCDQCRTRKIKCVANEKDRESTCEGCTKLTIECTYDYVKKKPGRKNSLLPVVKGHNGINGNSSSSSYAQTSHRTITSIRPQSQSNVISPAPLSVTNPQPVSSFTFSPAVKSSADSNINWLDSLLNDTGYQTINSFNTSTNELFGSTGAWDRNMSFASDQAQLLSLESPVELHVCNNTTDNSKINLALKSGPQIEDLTSWANISHFIALFLKYLYPILPLVHRPTFSEQLATRRDLVDTDFRALLLSIVAYVISQLPTNRLINDQFDIEGLKRLQRRCHRTCKALQRTYYGPTTSTQISTIIFDTFYLLSIGLAHTAGARLGQAIQLAYSMGLHSDSKTESLGLDPIEVQIRRRVFWQLYASDKTRAISGLPMMINDFQGVCSLPEPIDDEFITSQGSFPQPSSRPSPIAGFVAVSKLFRILSECFFHHRCIMNNVTTVDTTWTVGIEDQLHQLLQEFPEPSPDPSMNGPGIIKNMLAVQRANILITAAICKFALYDLRTALQLDKEQLAKEREGIAREIHSSLMNIPVEDLASNGESVRCKIFHIVCALCDQKPANGVDQDLIWDWYSMFSAISFVQMPPPPPEAALDSRANSPPPPPSFQQQYTVSQPETNESIAIMANAAST